MTWRFHAAFFIVASVVVALTVAWGFMIVGSPATRRTERFDEQRLNDLRTIAREIHSIVIDADKPRSLKGPLPKTLEELVAKARNEKVKLTDPETGEPYTYVVKDETTFEVCATFTQERNSDYSVFWNHPVGRHCFTINVVDPPPFY
jgi:hypothetical protein